MPLVGERTAAGFRSWRESPKLAWSRQYIQLGATGTSLAALVFDCDRPEAARSAILSGAVAVPNWKVTNPRTGHFHAAYCLDLPVHRYPEARPGPLKFAAQVCEFYQGALASDAGYAGTLTRNPAPQGHDYGDRTEWGVEQPYTLATLAEVIPFGWKRPTVAQTGVGRHVDLYVSGMKWAGNRANESIAVLPALMAVNQTFDPPLPLSDVQATARSIERYRARWSARGWHKPAWLESRKRRGRAGGIKSGEVRRKGSAEEKRPWEAEGISRRWWYEKRRRSKSALEAYTGSTPDRSIDDQPLDENLMKSEVKNRVGKILGLMYVSAHRPLASLRGRESSRPSRGARRTPPE